MTGYPKNGFKAEVEDNQDDDFLGLPVAISGGDSGCTGRTLRGGDVGRSGSSRSTKDGKDPPNSINQLSAKKRINCGRNHRTTSG